MKGFILGLILGMIAVWSWYQTGGKIHITETKTVTNEVVVTVTETNIIERTQYVTITNLVSAPLSVEEKTIKHPYPNATISRVEPDGITYITDTGVTKVLFPELPKDVREKYGYTPEKAKAYQEQQAALAAEQQKRSAEWLKQKKEKETADWQRGQDYSKSVDAKKAAEKAVADAIAQSNAARRAKAGDKPAATIQHGYWDKTIKFKH